MPPTPQPQPKPHSFTTRLPPHVYKELQKLIEGCSRQLRRQPSNSDMLGALILRARRERRGLLEDVADFMDVDDEWKAGKETLPKL